MWYGRQILAFKHVMPGLWLFLLFALGIPKIQAAEPYIISIPMKGAPLGLHFDILADPSNQLQLRDILQMGEKAEFRPSLEPVPNFGLRQGAQWIKFSITNPTDQAVTILLENKFTFIDSFELYLEGPNQTWIKKGAGDQLPFSERDIPTRQPVFRLDLQPGTHQFYGRSFADGTHQIPLHIWTQDEFFGHNAREYGFVGVLIGFHVVICLYNLFLFFSLRDPTYLYYVLYVTFNLCYQSAGLGLFQQGFSSLGWSETLSNRFMVMTVDMISITALLFSYHFLNIKQKLPAFSRIFLIIGILDATNLLITAFISVWLGTAICLLTASMTTSALITSGILISRQKYIPAIFYITGWSCYLLGVTGTITNLVALVPTSNFTRWGQFTGGAIEIAILSLALGARINAKRRQTVQMITRLNQELENKVDERTAEIHSLLKHIPQGILSIGREGVITPNYSAQLPRILDVERIAGESFRSIILDRSNLTPDEKDQAWQTILATVGENSINFDFNVDKLPIQLSYHVKGQVKELRLTWNRELNPHDEVKHILVTLLDVSSEVAARHEIERQNQEFDIIKQLVELGSRKSMQFFSSGDQLIQENARLAASPAIDADTIKILFVNTHTLKGAARSLKLKELANTLHLVESYYAEILKAGEHIDPRRIQQEFKEAEGVYLRYVRANRDILGRQDDLKKVTIDRELLHENVRLLNELAEIEAIPRSLKTMIDIQRHELTTMVFTNLASLASELSHHAEKIAQDLGREIPDFTIESPDILITSSQELALKNAFIHILRNALDHGIETPEVRLSQGKPARGKLLARAEVVDGRIVIDFKDDGKGLDIGRIRDICRLNGLGNRQRQAQELAELIFEAGFSTTEVVSLTSGRGVGLSAVRQFLEGELGTVSIILDSKLDGPGEFYEFTLRLALPAVAHHSTPLKLGKAG